MLAQPRDRRTGSRLTLAAAARGTRPMLRDVLPPLPAVPTEGIMEARHSRTRSDLFLDGRAGAVRHHGALRSARRGAQPYPLRTPLPNLAGDVAF